MRIVDAHHHVWRQTDLPWLLGPTQPRIFGPYDDIKRDYTIQEYLRDIESADVEASVYVQANWAPNWFADEVAWVSEQASGTGWPHAIVGYCDMLQRDARRDLDKLARFPLMRGIRQQLHWHKNALYRFAKSPDLARRPELHRNVGHLAGYDWSFDLQIFPEQTDGALTLIDACPRVDFILQHAGMLEDLSAAGRTLWRKQMLRLAERPNVYAKLSAFGTFIHRNDPEHIAWMIAETVAIFGAARCLFGSNFPIEKLWTDYGTLVRAFLDGAQFLSPAEREMVFSSTAKNVYRL
jgi:predicted TIM-barrel fold metal-dependent hydrolase